MLFAAKLAGVHTGVKVHVALVASQVIQPMRDQFSRPRTGKVVVQCLHLGLCAGSAFTGKIADQLFLLGVDADDRLTLL